MKTVHFTCKVSVFISGRKCHFDVTRHSKLILKRAATLCSHLSFVRHSFSLTCARKNVTSLMNCERYSPFSCRSNDCGTSTCEPPIDDSCFRPKKVLIVAKITRYEFEKRRLSHICSTESELRQELKRRGSDYLRLLEKHNIHRNFVSAMEKEFQRHQIEFVTVDRFHYSTEGIEWADAIFTAGGDGTFLLAASKISDSSKPVIGINTDPESSEGYMCLKKDFTSDQFADVLDSILSGRFEWLWRQRIRVTLSGENAFDEPIELHEQQLKHPEDRWAEDVHELEETSRNLRTSSSSSEHHYGGGGGFRKSGGGDNGQLSRVLPFLALNEVFIGESVSSRVSYYNLKIDDGDFVKQKSSGLTICTGTGSTSWHFNINKMTHSALHDILKIVQNETGVSLPCEDKSFLQKVCQQYNDHIIFHPSDVRMAYTVRDPVYNSIFQPGPYPAHGFARKVTVKSRCWDANLVIDGGMSFKFNNGSEVELEIRPQDALKTMAFS